MTIISFPEFLTHISDTLLPRLEHLQVEIADAGKCCDLKSISFEGGHVPDYSLEVVQDLYMLRYYGGYLCEYRTIYEEVLKFLKTPIHVRSLGAGSGVDLAALYFEVRERRIPLGIINWYGYDLVKWSNRITFPGLSARYRECSVAKIDHFSPEVNVILFPKSISEFDDETFNALLVALHKSRFKSEKVVVASSARAQSRSLNLDIRRFQQVADVFTEHHDYRSEDESDKFWRFRHENTAWASIYAGFSLPDAVVEFLKNLAERCPSRIRKGRPCMDDCDLALSRWPILKAKAVRYQIMRLER